MLRKDIQSNFVENKGLGAREKYLCRVIANPRRWYWAQKENVKLGGVGFGTWGKWVRCRTCEIRQRGAGLGKWNRRTS